MSDGGGICFHGWFCCKRASLRFASCLGLVKLAGPPRATRAIEGWPHPPPSPTPFLILCLMWVFAGSQHSVTPATLVLGHRFIGLGARLQGFRQLWYPIIQFPLFIIIICVYRVIYQIKVFLLLGSSSQWQHHGGLLIFLLKMSFPPHQLKAHLNFHVVNYIPTIAKMS